jgi:hypothetical protein
MNTLRTVIDGSASGWTIVVRNGPVSVGNDRKNRRTAVTGKLIVGIAASFAGL